MEYRLKDSCAVGAAWMYGAMTLAFMTSKGMRPHAPEQVLQGQANPDAMAPQLQPLSATASGWGIGSWRALLSMGLCHLALLCPSWIGSGARAKRFRVACWASSVGSDAGEERVEFNWDVKVVEEELARRILPS